MSVKKSAIISIVGKPNVGKSTLLNRLVGTKIAIVSNKPDAAVKALCADLFPGLYVLGETADCPRKPAPDMIFKACREIGVDTCVYVGDSDIDYMTACRAGMRPLSVSWGYRPYEFLRSLGDQPIARTPAELERLLNDMGL